jgi:hypothetical protein
VGGGPRDDVVAEDADALDLGLDVVPGLQVELERVGLHRRDPRDGPEFAFTVRQGLRVEHTDLIR